ncbi:MAG: right-handed parallel beta-helix repeat-containing protein [Paludibacter sp.]|nr:right-handed parallel beta-helix repeat-containing protein [Paludibacter sp.]
MKQFRITEILATIILCIFFLYPNAILAGNTIVVDSTVTNIDAKSTRYKIIQPGDTVLLAAGKRRILRIANFKGDSLNPVIFKNYGGAVEIANQNLAYGIDIVSCSHIRFTGSGNPDYKYGIRVLETQSGGHNGLSIGYLSSDVEVDHIEIGHAGFAGIFSVNQPTCDGSANRGNFVQYNTIIHDNYIHHTGGEGMYIGHSFYSGYTKICDGDTVILYPHELKGLKIYNNILDSCGYDGIQAGCAVEDCAIYNNVVTNYGTKKVADQHTGIQIGGGTTGLCYNNIIMNGSGSGIMVFGLGNNFIFNNLICNAGQNYYPEDLTKKIYGIFCDDRTTIPGESFNFINNTIIRPKIDGIRIYSDESANDLIYNNLIIGPDSLMYRYDMSSRFICVTKGVDAVLATNYFVSDWPHDITSDDIQQIYDYCNTLDIHEQGTNVAEYGITFDLFNNECPVSGNPDIGAIQYNNSVPERSQAKSSSENNSATTNYNNKISGLNSQENTNYQINRADITSILPARENIVIRNMNGQIVYSGSKLSKQSSYNLPAGIYIITNFCTQKNSEGIITQYSDTKKAVLF